MTQAKKGVKWVMEITSIQPDQYQPPSKSLEVVKAHCAHSCPEETHATLCLRQRARVLLIGGTKVAKRNVFFEVLPQTFGFLLPHFP